MDRLVYKNGEEARVGDLFIRRKDYGLVVKIDRGYPINSVWVFWGGCDRPFKWVAMEYATLVERMKS